MLQKVADRGDKRNSPIIYSWINVTCHVSASFEKNLTNNAEFLF
jgi:hypothetical protein